MALAGTSSHSQECHVLGVAPGDTSLQAEHTGIYLMALYGEAVLSLKCFKYQTVDDRF